MTITNTTVTPTSTSAASAATSTTSTTSGGSTALNQLSGNFNNFLNLLMTQLQYQDPTAPMDSAQFTSQLVPYSSVEQQINTNTNLTSLIQATQSNTILQSSSMIGKQVNVTADQLALQNGAASLSFNAPAAEPVHIAVYSASGVKVQEAAMSAQAGNNTWNWNGQDSQGNQLPDGPYKVEVLNPTETAIATTVTGTVTGLSRSSTGLNVSLGGVSTDINNVQSIKT